MHVQPNSGPPAHAHTHKIKAPEIQPLDIVPVDDDGPAETGEAPTNTAGSFSDPLTPETAFNSHVIGGEGEGDTGPGKSGKSTAHVARQLIAEGLTGFAGLADGVGGKQPFGQIVSQVARGILTLDGAREAAAAAAAEAEAAAAAAAAAAEAAAEEGGEVPADGGDVVEGDIVAPQTAGTLDGMLLEALDDAVEDAAPVEDDTVVVEEAVEETIVVEETVDDAIGVPVPDVADDLLTDALLDMLDGAPTDGEANTTGDEVV